VSLSLGGQIYDPDGPMGKLFFDIVATFAEFEVDLIRMRTHEGMAVARAQGTEGVSAQTEIGDRTRQVSMNSCWVVPVHRDTSAVERGRTR